MGGAEMNKEVMEERNVESLYQDARLIIEQARGNAVRSVDFCRVQMYWHLGRRIFEEEQQGKERAEYGTYLIRNLAKRLLPEYGSGFGIRQLETSRQFFMIYPIAHTLRAQLNWSQYKLLISITDPDKREYYELESVNNAWTARETKRQINSMLYERLLMSNDKESVLAVARKQRIPESPTEVIKEPMVLEFLGLHREASYYEKDLESAIISHLTEFLLEMGKGFSFAFGSLKSYGGAIRVFLGQQFIASKNIYAGGELVEKATAEFFSVVQKEGTREVSRKDK